MFREHTHLVVNTIKRCGELLLTVGTATLLAYALLTQLQVDAILAQLSDIASANPELIAFYREQYSLIHGKSIVTGNLVYQDILRYALPTLELGSLAFLLAVILSFVICIYAPITANVISALCTSMPTFWVAYMFLVIFYGYLGVTPGPGYNDPIMQDKHAQYLIGPTIVLASSVMGPLVAVLHTALQREHVAQYVRTARMKGLRESRIVWVHILKNAAPPVLTAAGMIYASLLTGAIMTETLFAWPGLGQYLFRAAQYADTAAILGVVVFSSILYFVIMVICDTIRLIMDPRR